MYTSPLGGVYKVCKQHGSHRSAQGAKEEYHKPGEYFGYLLRNKLIPKPKKRLTCGRLHSDLNVALSMVGFSLNGGVDSPGHECLRLKSLRFCEVKVTGETLG